MEVKINLTPEEEEIAKQLISEYNYKSLEDYALLVVQMDLKNFRYNKEMQVMRAGKVKTTTT